MVFYPLNFSRCSCTSQILKRLRYWSYWWLYEPSESTGSEPVIYRTRSFSFFTVYHHVDILGLKELLFSFPPVLELQHTHPIRKLPVEIIRNIFEYVSDPPSQASTMDSMPWNLSYVCSWWRTVTLTTSSLWANILIDFSKDLHLSSLDPIIRERKTQIILIRLFRSQQSPLKITIMSPYTDLEGNFIVGTLIPFSTLPHPRHTLEEGNFPFAL